jgi:hypothetical protein
LNDPLLYSALADGILLLHFLVVLFVLAGLAAGLCWLAWRQPRWAVSPWFRYAHLGAVAIIVLQAWLGRLCPLTLWENALRQSAGQPVYEESFVQHWLHGLLFYDLPFWVFTAAYTLFGAAVLWVWWRTSKLRKMPTGRHSA